VRVEHLAIPVADQERGREFYARYFGFEGPAQRYEDDTLIVRSADGFSLALGRNDPVFLHFGFRAESPEAVRAFRDRLRADGVEIVGEWDEPKYVSVKCRDPNGYVVELAWEIPEPNE
jgi:catechol 2,3-dioxygenase-like lactoylglutathione lyase family enzyme